MSTGKLIGYLALMTVMGLAAFAALGWLVEYRQGRPLEAPDAPYAVADGAGPMARLAEGARSAAAAAHALLGRGERSPAAHALDAALRATEVGHHAAAGETKTHFQAALHAVRATRAALQNGHPGRARTHLAEAVDALAAAQPAPALADAQLLPADHWRGYEGATLLNAQGVRIGEVESLAATDDGLQVSLRLGGGRDVLGLFDVATTPPASARADQLVFGPDRIIGSSLVVLPAATVDPAALRRYLDAAR